jgi:lysophospholipase L1-like esterase
LPHGSRAGGVDHPDDRRPVTPASTHLATPSSKVDEQRPRGPVRPRSGQTTFKLVTLGLLLLVFVAALELVLRVVSPPSPFSPLIPLRPHNRMKLHVDLRGVSPVAIHTTNSWGLRGPEPSRNLAEARSIITVGGSTTQCFFLDDRKTWPHLLGEKLKDTHRDVWVGNGGLDGHSTRAHVLFMDEVIARVRPRIVVILAGANDLGFSISRRFREAGNPLDRASTGWRYSAFAGSRLLQVLYLWKKIVVDDATVVKAGGHGNFVPKRLPPGEERFDGNPMPDTLDPLLTALPEYRANLERIIRRSRAVNVRVVFMTQPTLFEDTEYWRSIEGGIYWLREPRARLAAATERKLLDAYNRVLLETCRAERAECFDLAPLVPSDERHFYDAFHLTELGAEVVADRLADYLRKTL